jgi:putative radical SAM enzyme (TIGR03279 family)
VVRIAEIEAGSIAAGLSLEIGARIVRINGEPVRDGIDLAFLLAEERVALEALTPAGEEVLYEFEREPGKAVGIVPEPDPVRECANKCVFCFIDGNPDGARKTLWLRDDDFRLSFTYGSYVTLTNLGPKGLARLVQQRISPLYVSVHATEPDVRERLLANRRAGLILEQLRELVGGGLDIHAQVVLCPGWNDGPHLERTIEDLWGLGPRIRSLSVVPVGLTRYNLNRPIRLLSRGEAIAAIERVDAARARALSERGYGWCYAADELYLIAGREIPAAAYYDEGALHENGVGAVRRFIERFERGLARVAIFPGRRIRLVTGASMAPFLRERASRLAEATLASAVEVVEVENEYFGPTVTVAGLLAGRDILRALSGSGERGSREGDVVLVPAEALNADDRFIDDLSRAELLQGLGSVDLRSGYEVTEALRAS